MFSPPEKKITFNFGGLEEHVFWPLTNHHWGLEHSVPPLRALETLFHEQTSDACLKGVKRKQFNSRAHPWVLSPGAVGVH